MSTAVAPAPPAEIAKPLVNPLTIDTTAVAVARLDNLVNGFIDDAVGQIDSEIDRMMRRREVAASVRGILRVKASLDEAVAAAAESGMPELVAMTLDGERADLVAMYQTLNPAQPAEKVGEVVDKLLDGYREQLKPKPKTRGK